MPDIDSACVSDIKNLGWWQGSFALKSSFVENGIDVPFECDFWVLASQTCNICSENFESVPLVEWIGASKIDAKTYTESGIKSSGSHPRNLFVYATSSDGLEQEYFSLEIHARIWHDRRKLAKLVPLSIQLRDSVTGSAAKQKDAFIGWMARSYTRVELSNELNDALTESRVIKILDKEVAGLSSDLYGIYLEIASNDGVHPTHLIPAANNMCDVDVMFICKDTADILDIQTRLSNAMKRKVGNPLKRPDAKDGLPKEVELVERAKHYFLNVTVLAKSWTDVNLNQLGGLVRYTLQDHLSNSTEPI